MTIPRIKVCCIGSIEEAKLAISLGASAVGLVSAMPSGPGVINEDLIADIARSVPPPIGTFLLTSRQSVKQIVAQHRGCRTNTIQICDHLIDGEYDDLRAALPGISLVQVIHVGGTESIDQAVELAPKVDALLLDSGNQRLAIKELGGTGRVHDWTVSRRICEAVDRPVFLAGGLRPDNVSEALVQVGPFGIDVCSGVRTDGRLDPAKLRAFISAAHQEQEGRIVGGGHDHVGYPRTQSQGVGSQRR
jgi:phosphoribosylanthranilate isomerase